MPEAFFTGIYAAEAAGRGIRSSDLARPSLEAAYGVRPVRSVLHRWGLREERTALPAGLSPGLRGMRRLLEHVRRRRPRDGGAEIVYELDTRTFLAITRRELSGMKAYQQKRVRLKASLPDMLKLRKIDGILGRPRGRGAGIPSRGFPSRARGHGSGPGMDAARGARYDRSRCGAPLEARPEVCVAARRLAVVAIGGNSLIRDRKHQTVEDQVEALRITARHLADMVEAGWDLAIGHGNGPQVGFILRRSEIAHRVEGMHEVPLDVCGADTQGAIGYELQQALQNELYHRGVKKNVATLITQTLVDHRDPAFQHPTKPIGGFMDEAEARRREREMGWSVLEDAGRGWRRVVPSPLPKEIVELDSIKALLDGGVVTIAVGGGGIPVVDVGEGEYRGVAAVVDKDYALSLLARAIGADLFLISTSVERVALDWGTPRERWIERMTAAQARGFLAEGTHFAQGSMAPKIQAVLWYLEGGGGRALITSPEAIGRALLGETGTLVVP